MDCVNAKTGLSNLETLHVLIILKNSTVLPIAIEMILLQENGVAEILQKHDCKGTAAI